MQECECKLKRNITKALLKAQEDFDSIEADHTNPMFKNKYAKLVDLYNACKKALRKQNILISHRCDTHPVTYQQTSKTILTHIETGETFEDIRFLVPERPGSQGHGAAETYMKKYALKSLLGTDVGEDDDDGEAERIHMLQVQKFINFVNQYPLPTLFKDICKEFSVSDISKLNSYQLFDATLFVIQYFKNYAAAQQKIASKDK